MDTKVSNIEDAIMKNAVDVFREDALKFFGIHQKVVSVSRTEMKDINITTGFMDYTFLLEDDTCIHFEFQTTDSRDDLPRFLLYDAMFYYKERRKIKTVVIYSANIDNTMTELDVGLFRYNVEAVYMGCMDGDERFEYLKNKVRNGEKLTRQDMLSLVFIPIMKIRDNKNERILNAVQLADSIPDHNDKLNCLSLLYAFAEKFADRDYKEKIKEVIRMTEIGKMIWDEASQKGIEIGILEVAKKLIGMGLKIEQIKEATGLSEDEIKKLMN